MGRVVVLNLKVVDVDVSLDIVLNLSMKVEIPLYSKFCPNFKFFFPK